MDRAPFMVGDLVTTNYFDQHTIAPGVRHEQSPGLTEQDHAAERARVRRVTHVERGRCQSGWLVRADGGGGEFDVPYMGEPRTVGRGTTAGHSICSSWLALVEKE